MPVRRSPDSVLHLGDDIHEYEKDSCVAQRERE